MTTKKSILLAVLVVVLLTFSVSGTIAWLTTSTKPIENTFTPATVDTVINEEFDKVTGYKELITVTNKDESTNVPVYVRVRLVANWVNEEGEIVKSETISPTYNQTNWTKSGEYYYYNSKLAVGATTENLLAEDITQPTDGPTDESLQIVVLHQSIQAEGGAVASATNWTITKPTN